MFHTDRAFIVVDVRVKAASPTSAGPKSDRPIGYFATCAVRWLNQEKEETAK